MSAAGRFGLVMATLWAAHDLADHVVQTDHQAANKASSWSAMAGHIGTYQATQLGALLAVSRATGTPLSWRGMLAGGAFSAVTHAFLDRRWPVRRALELTGSPRFAVSYVQPECELPVAVNVDGDLDGLTNLEESSNALVDAVGATGRGDWQLAGEALAHAVRHAVVVINPERPTPLHGPYLADQALHHACLLVSALLIAGRR